MVNKGTYVPPWTRQKRLQTEYIDEDVPDIYEIDKLLTSIEYGVVNPRFQTLRARALFAMYYLTACRLSEILEITPNDLKFKLIDGRKCLQIKTINRKHRKRKRKILPIPIQREKIIVKHITIFGKTIPRENLLFDFKKKRATQIINDISGYNVHFIRHIRATHLVAKYNFNEQLLIRFMGWTDSRPAKHYMELKTGDVFRQFYRR